MILYSGPNELAPSLSLIGHNAGNVDYIQFYCIHLVKYKAISYVTKYTALQIQTLEEIIW